MTEAKIKGRRIYSKNAGSVIIFLSFLFILLRFASEIREAITEAMSLSVNVVLPSLFPFMILSDYLNRTVKIKENSIIGRCFESLFGISALALPSFMVGTICGFPLGIKCATALYEDGGITKGEYERLCAIANNPSLAFTVSAVGVGMRGSITEGLMLYISVVSSAVIVGIICKQKRDNFAISRYKPEQKFILSDSVRSAGFACISICSYIIFFSALCAVVKFFIKSDELFLLVSPLFEISGGCILLAKSGVFSSKISLILTAFSLGFSGFSVHIQGFSFMSRDASRVGYLMRKLLQGAICAAIVFLFSFI